MTCECYQVRCPLHPGDEPFCALDPCRHPVAVWPDGTECELDEIEKMTHLSDDFRVEFKDDYRSYAEAWDDYFPRVPRDWVTSDEPSPFGKVVSLSQPWPADVNIAFKVSDESA